MEQSIETKQATLFDLTQGRDELNLAEFPIFFLGQRVPKDMKTIEYTREAWDESRQAKVPRKMRIVASDLYGLPTVGDADVLLAVLLIGKQTGAFDRNQGGEIDIVFSLYDLAKVLGWSD